eukprot:TRINITY_DN612_c0_g1_i7.p1 TRINITY_DN612_c0_g1~~TRINITY_DN612_c0_g1_i7.p1  ORF type:complete len:285 (-),score=58.78 TRINITY_DN612_c0_g1_i7:306-1160(-)
MSMFANTMWQAQKALHGNNNNVVLPAMLLAVAGGLVLYSHANDEHGDPTKTFLALIIVQMLPLIFLEAKILSCPDPVSMLGRFGAKVLLMHGCFLGLRVCAWPLLEVGFGISNLLGLAAVGIALHFGFGFRWTLGSAYIHKDVIGLILLALGAAACTEMVDWHMPTDLIESTIFTASSYIEILAFVPAVWLVHQTAKKNEDMVSSTRNVQAQATFFFAFLVAFYIMEDVASAFKVYMEAPVAAIGHMVHFGLLLDFACFILAHIYNPDRSPGSLLRYLPGQIFV